MLIVCPCPLSLWHQFEGLVEALYDAISLGMVGVVLMALIWRL